MSARETLRPVLARLAEGAALSEAEARAAFDIVLAGEASPAQIGALLMGLRLGGESVGVLSGAARAMRARMRAVVLPGEPIDVCGTGGDGRATLNVSTAVAFVVAGAGVAVAKHGNRAASSRSGGADVLEALGVRLDPPPERLPEILRAAGCVFLFAPLHHPALAAVAAARAELGMRTAFNMLGPLVNPAGVRRQLVGVADPDLAVTMARVLEGLGAVRSWVVHGTAQTGAGTDELSLEGVNHVVMQDGAGVRSTTLCAAELGLARAPVAALIGGDAAENAACLLALLREMPPEGDAARARHDAYRDTVLLNTAAALLVAGRSGALAEGLEMARVSLASGAALGALDRLRRATAGEG